LDFFGDWSEACKEGSSIISKLESENGGKWVIIKVDIDQEALLDLAERHQIRGVPTLAFYKGAKKTYQKTGLVNEAIIKELEKKYLV
jgi:thioredoxin-like negative regulator of GroEL